MVDHFRLTYAFMQAIFTLIPGMKLEALLPQLRPFSHPNQSLHRYRRCLPWVSHIGILHPGLLRNKNSKGADSGPGYPFSSYWMDYRWASMTIFISFVGRLWPYLKPWAHLSRPIGSHMTEREVSSVQAFPWGYCWPFPTILFLGQELTPKPDILRPLLCFLKLFAQWELKNGLYSHL